MRILIISANALSLTSNNGKTYRSFIRNIPKCDIAQLYTGSNEYPDESCCDNYYRITDIQLFKGIIKFWKPIKNSHEDLMTFVRSNKIGTLTDSRFIKGIKRNSKNLSYLRDFLWSSNKWNNTELDNWIKAFNPTHVFAVLGGDIALHRVARKISNKYNVPLSVYFTDDYVLNDNSTNYIQKSYFNNIRKEYRKTLKYADKAFVIGDKMKFAYEDFFKRRFQVLINGIEFNEDTRNRRLTIIKKQPIVISYIGGLHLNRWKTIVKLSRILKSIPDYTFDVRVFSVAPPNKDIVASFEKHGIKFCGALTADGVQEQTRNSHIMLHVESFDIINRTYTQFSISTKIPEYMSSMRGIIAYGPHEIASIQIFKDNKIGCVLTDLDSEVEIKELITNYLKQYNQLDFNYQYEFAKKHFNQQLMQLNQLL